MCEFAVTCSSSMAEVISLSLASTSVASAWERSSSSTETPVCPAIYAKVKASASGATCVRCSSAPASTKQSKSPASSTSMTSAKSRMPLS